MQWYVPPGLQRSLVAVICCLLSALPCGFAQPYATQAVLPDYARYYTLNLDGFNQFTNGVWSDVYNWDDGKQTTDINGNVIGGWKQLYEDNLVFDHYTEYGGYWEGFCISDRDFVYDNPDPLNQFSAVTLGGVEGKGANYMVAYYGVDNREGNNCRLWMNDGVACGIAGMYVTNTQYDYLSLMQGDGFAHAFKQGDWFLLTAYGYDENNELTGSAEFYLADYRSASAADHYIIQDWRWFDLSALGKVAGVEFVLTSGDNSVYGMNTPSYFCMDKLTLSLVSVQRPPVATAVCKGDSAVFTVGVSGSDYYNASLKGYYPRVQWRKNGVDIAGATDTLLVLNRVEAADTGAYSCYVNSTYYTAMYRVLFKDSSYVAAVESPPAELAVRTEGGAAPVIVQQPEGARLPEGSSYQLTVGAAGNQLRYQWYKDGTVVTGDVAAQLLLGRLQAADAGTYSCVVSSGCGGLATSNGALIEVVMPWSIYPNPAAGGQLVTLKGYKGYEVSVYTMSGQLVQAFRANSDSYQFAAPAVKGMYLLYCKKDTVYNYEKLLVQ